MEFAADGTIRLDKEVNELDKFVLDFVRVLEKHSRYVVISGYVAILLGRSRATEDIDMFIPPIAKKTFCVLFNELVAEGFWCLATDSCGTAYEYLEAKTALRFARKDVAVPNVEVKIARKPLDREALKETKAVRVGKRILQIAPLELQIPFKKLVLGSDKDIEDARHLETVAAGRLDREKIKRYEALISSYEGKKRAV